jgi:hypothetical protein
MDLKTITENAAAVDRPLDKHISLVQEGGFMNRRKRVTAAGTGPIAYGAAALTTAVPTSAA